MAGFNNHMGLFSAGGDPEIYTSTPARSISQKCPKALLDAQRMLLSQSRVWQLSLPLASTCIFESVAGNSSSKHLTYHRFPFVAVSWCPHTSVASVSVPQQEPIQRN